MKDVLVPFLSSVCKSVFQVPYRSAKCRYLSTISNPEIVIKPVPNPKSLDRNSARSISQPRMLHHLLRGRPLSPFFSQQRVQKMFGFGRNRMRLLFGGTEDRVLRARKGVFAVEDLRSSERR